MARAAKATDLPMPVEVRMNMTESAIASERAYFTRMIFVIELVMIRSL
jgi:hypothetical protein